MVVWSSFRRNLANRWNWNAKLAQRQARSLFLYSCICHMRLKRHSLQAVRRTDVENGQLTERRRGVHGKQRDLSVNRFPREPAQRGEDGAQGLSWWDEAAHR